MKTHAIEWTHNKRQSSFELKPALTEKSGKALTKLTQATLTLLPAVAIVIMAVWISSNPNLEIYLRVTLWTSGFLFVGLAFDAKTPIAALLLATAVALPVLAYLSAVLAGEIAIVGAMLIALWISAAVSQSIAPR